LHTNLFNIVLISFFLTLGTTSAYSQDVKKKNTTIPAKKEITKAKEDKTKNIVPTPTKDSI
jgi:hypothetical protein